jgi:hypothetical protein
MVSIEADKLSSWRKVNASPLTYDRRHHRSACFPELVQILGGDQDAWSVGEKRN